MDYEALAADVVERAVRAGAEEADVYLQTSTDFSVQVRKGEIETLTLTHTQAAPWTVIRSDDKRRARLAAIRTVLSGLDYDGKDAKALGQVDGKICGGPALWDA